MSDLSRVLERIVLDPAFRGRLLRDPAAALEGYALSDAERQDLARPGPHWMDLVARVLRAGEIPAGPAWDPWDGEDGVEPPDEDPGIPAGPFAGLAPARVLLRVGVGRTADGQAAWTADLQPDAPEARRAAPDEVVLAVELSEDAGQLQIRWGPPEPPPAEAERAEAWSENPFDHRPDHPRARAAARQALAAPPTERAAALRDYVRLVRDPSTDEALVEAPEPVSREEDEAAPAPLPAWRRASPPAGATAHITVVGLGLTGVEHITREAEEALRCAQEVLYVDTGVGTRAFLEARCPLVRPLYAESYRSGEERLGTYTHVVSTVLAAALDHPPVVLAVPGHPTVFSLMPLLLRDAAPGLGLTVHIQPGISAEDAILSLLGLDPGDHGILAVEATDLLLRRRPLLPDVLTLVWQVGVVETRLHSGRPSRPVRFERLSRWLCRTWPAHHRGWLVHVPSLPGLSPTVHPVSLGALPAHAEHIHHATTLVIPPVGRRPLADPELARQVDDPAHLKRITRSLELPEPG